MVCESIKLNIFVGSKIGTFKNVYYNNSSKKKRKGNTRQLEDVKSLQKGEGITCMAFLDSEETEVILGKENRIIKTYNLLNDQFTDTYNVDFGEGSLHSLSCYNDTFIGAVQSGIVKVWHSKTTSEFQINAGPNLECMRHCIDNKILIGTGGKENDLTIWDLNKKESVFRAKNVPHDWLQLRVPIWVSDIAFLPNTDGQLVAMCSRYGVVRLYDTRAQRRPVCSVEFQRQANTCISPGFRERQILVGTGRGFLQMVDLRGRGKPDKSFKGSAGAVSAAVCIPEKGVVVSTSLDRHLRIHDSVTKELLHKQYMTTKLTALLVRSADKTPLPFELLENEERLKKEEVKEEYDVSQENKSDSEYEDIFNNMEVVGENISKKKKHKHVDNDEVTLEESITMDDNEDVSHKTPKKSKKSGTPSAKHPSKKQKRSDESAVVDNEESEVPLDESIKKLLKSTEKIKRGLEKKKQDKKRRSVFNC